MNGLGFLAIVLGIAAAIAYAISKTPPAPPAE